MSTVAYVLWHRPRPEVDAGTYEAALLGFQRRLLQAGISGLSASAAFRIDDAPWLGAGGAAYEDWYLIDELGTLVPLETGAIAAAMAGPHDAVAALAADGVAGVYRLRGGAAALESGPAQWFAKPEGMSYDGLDAAVGVAAPGGLWSRVMTLGPSPEFHLAGAGALAPPFTAIRIARHALS